MALSNDLIIVSYLHVLLDAGDGAQHDGHGQGQRGGGEGSHAYGGVH